MRRRRYHHEKMTSARRMVFGAALLLAPASARAAGEGMSAELRQGFAMHKGNIVAITYTLRPLEKPTGGEGRKVEDALCGVIVDASGLILTSGDPFPDLGGDPRHTLGPVEFKVHRAGRAPLDAEPVGLDRDLNLAWLRLKSPPAGLAALEWADAERLEVGDEVAVMGVMSRNYDFAPVIHPTVVNAVVDKPRRMYSVDAHLNDFSIGGLVLSSRGKPIGIIGEDVLKERVPDGTLPRNPLSILGSMAQGRRPGYPMIFTSALFASQLGSPPPIEKDPKRSWLGIIMQPLSEDLSAYWKLDVEGGIIVASVLDGSPADKAGLRPADILVALEGESLRVRRDEELPEFRRKIERVGPGMAVSLEYLRQGERHNATVTLAEAPRTAVTAAEREDEDLGLIVREITLDDIQGQALEPGVTGVVVAEVDGGGWARIGGLDADDIIQAIGGVSVANLEDFQVAMDRLRKTRPDSTVMFVRRRTETLFVRMRTPWRPTPADSSLP